MAYDEDLAARVRDVLSDHEGLGERRMFGGLAFMLRGNMACGVLKDELIVRLGPEAGARALEQPHTRPFDFTGRPMRGFLFVGPSGTREDCALRGWVARAAAFALGLPPK